MVSFFLSVLPVLFASENALALSGQLSDRSRSLLQSTSTAYVELVIVNDPAMYTAYGESTDNLLAFNLETMAETVHLYLDANGVEINGESVEIDISVVDVVTWENWTDANVRDTRPEFFINAEYDGSDTACANDDGNIFNASRFGTADYCEASYVDYLSKFSQWKIDNFADADAAILLTYYDLYQTIVDYSNLPGMCTRTSSVGIVQATYGPEFTAVLVAQAIGNLFDMKNDGTQEASECDDTQYIMSAVLSPFSDTLPDEFSTCSIDSMEAYLVQLGFGGNDTSTCLDNVPNATYALPNITDTDDDDDGAGSGSAYTNVTSATDENEDNVGRNEAGWIAAFAGLCVFALVWFVDA